jgi:hypothetical protein
VTSQRASVLPFNLRSLGLRALTPITGSALLVLTSGCSEEVELPTPPDMSALVQAYRSPNGKINSQTAASFGKAMADNVTSGQETSPVEVVGEMVHDMQDVGGGAAPPAAEGTAPTGSGEQSVRGSRIDLSAIVRLDHTCRGWGDTASNDPANGSLEITATLDQNGLVPVIWGNASGCRIRRGDTQLELDGDLRLRIGEEQPRVGLRYLTQLGYLVEFEGKVITNRSGTPTEVAVHSHFQIYENREVRFLINLGDGTRVVGAVDPNTIVPTNTSPIAQVSVLESDGRWTCMVNIQQATGSCTKQDDPTNVVTW